MSGNVGFCSRVEDDFEFFLRWAAIIGISNQSSTAPCQPTDPLSCLKQALDIAYFADAGGRGLGATRDITRGEMVLKIPRSALLTKENVLNDDKIAACIAKHSHMTPTQILIVCLLAEVGKGKDSLWHLYLMQLPRSYNLLASFKKSEVQAFQVDYAIEVSNEAVSKCKLDWKQATLLMQELDLSPRLQTFQSWLWAFATVSSRALHVPWDSAGCLCPVGDLFNYDAPGDECSFSDMEEGSFTSDIALPSYSGHSKLSGQLDEFSWRLTDGGFDEELNCYCFYARRNYRKGEQVLLCYGTYTNLELLEHYGFLLDANPNDKIFIKLDAAVYTCNSWPKDSLYIQQDGRPSYALLCVLRLWATPTKLRKSASRLAYSGSRLSTENEKTVMQFLSKSCHDTVEELPSSAEDDEMLLQSIDDALGGADSVSCLPDSCELRNTMVENCPDTDTCAVLLPKNLRSLERTRLAVKWRLVYKRALLNCISYCSDAINSLQT